MVLDKTMFLYPEAFAKFVAILIASDISKVLTWYVTYIVYRKCVICKLNAQMSRRKVFHTGGGVAVFAVLNITTLAPSGCDAVNERQLAHFSRSERDTATTVPWLGARDGGHTVWGFWNVFLRHRDIVPYLRSPLNQEALVGQTGWKVWG